MSILELNAAYGRVYKTKKAVLEDWEAGKDFVIDTMGEDFGRYTSNRDIPLYKLRGIKWVNIRYKNDREVAVIKL